MSAPLSQSAAEPARLSRGRQKLWAVGGCIGCSGFLALALILSLLGVRRALDPGNVWGQLGAYMQFESPPEGFAALFVLPFFDQRQIAFYRVEDQAQVILQEYSGRTREDFDLAFDVEHLEEQPSLANAVLDQLTLQGRAVRCVRFVGTEARVGAAAADPAEAGGLRGRLLDLFDLRPEKLPEFRTDTPVVRIHFSGSADSGGTTLMVRSPNDRMLTEADLEALFEPFDLWSQVGSAPQPPPDPESDR